MAPSLQVIPWNWFDWLGALAGLNSAAAPPLLDWWSVVRQDMPKPGLISFAPSIRVSNNIDCDNIIKSLYVVEQLSGSR